MQHLTNEFDLLIFDLDGTLVDTRRDLANAVNEALKKIGKEELGVETITRYVGDGVRKLLERAVGHATEEQLEIASGHFKNFYAAHLTDFSRLYPGIREMLAHFAGKRKAILTNKPQEFTEAILQRLDIRSHFEIVIGGKPNLPLKPSPEAIAIILEHLGIPPAGAVMIGDGENDMLAGKAAGIATCAVTYGFRPAINLLALKPDFVISDPGEIKRLFIL